MVSEERRLLLAWLTSSLGWDDESPEVRRISEGHSREMVVVTPANGKPVVVRIEQGGVFGTQGSEECRIMAALNNFDVPISNILARDLDGSVMGRPFFVMEYVDHDDTLPSPVNDFIAALHRLHKLDVAHPSFVGVFDNGIPVDARAATLAQIHRWRDVYRSSVSEPNAILEEVAMWLETHLPNGGHLSVIHGDAGPGNFVHNGEKVLAITDWEFSHLGDPMEDWVFCIQMRGSRALPKDEWFGRLENLTGIKIDPEVWHFWETFNYFKGACANLTCRHLYETGVNPAPNMAIVGTAIHRGFLRRLVDLI